MLLYAAEVDVELVEVLQEGAERRAFRHLGKGVDIFREALAAVAELTVGAGDVGVGVIDIAGEEHAGVDLAPVGSHLLAVLAAGVEVGDFVCAEDVVHVLGQLCFQRSHDGEFLADKDLGEQILRAGEDHGLFVEVLDESTLGEELGHVADLVSGLFGEAGTGTGEDGCAYENRYVGQVLDEFGHEGQVLCPIFLCRNVYLQESDVNVAQVIIVALVGVRDKEFALGVVVFQPVFEGSSHEAASDNSNFNHDFINVYCVYNLFLSSCSVWFTQKAYKGTTIFLYTQVRAQ